MVHLLLCMLQNKMNYKILTGGCSMTKDKLVKVDYYYHSTEKKYRNGIKHIRYDTKPDYAQLHKNNTGDSKMDCLLDTRNFFYYVLFLYIFVISMV